MFLGGSGTVSDSCGNTYEIEWTCNSACSGLDVIEAINEFAEEECPGGTFIYQAN